MGRVPHRGARRRVEQSREAATASWDRCAFTRNSWRIHAVAAAYGNRWTVMRSLSRAKGDDGEGIGSIIAESKPAE